MSLNGYNFLSYLWHIPLKHQRNMWICNRMGWGGASPCVCTCLQGLHVESCYWWHSSIIYHRPCPQNVHCICCLTWVMVLDLGDKREYLLPPPLYIWNLRCSYHSFQGCLIPKSIVFQGVDQITDQTAKSLVLSQESVKSVFHPRAYWSELWKWPWVPCSEWITMPIFSLPSMEQSLNSYRPPVDTNRFELSQTSVNQAPAFRWASVNWGPHHASGFPSGAIMWVQFPHSNSCHFSI